MVKLNYTNRRIEGEKLGEIIAKDLTKRVSPGSASKAALRDPVVELHAAGRGLTDANVAVALHALAEGIPPPEERETLVYYNHLEELCLAGNQLTAGSLSSLASTVYLAADDLRDIDLSNNQICVNEEESVQLWDGFLAALKHCTMLRRLDLSGNPLGAKAFESLARSYNRETIISLEGDASDDAPEDLLPEDKKGKTKVQASADTSNVTPNKGRRQKGSSTQTESVHSVTESNLHQYRTTRGLRAVPYMVFSDTGITDLCALHLSRVLEQHHLPGELLPFVPPAKSGQVIHQLEAYECSDCWGIIYRPDESLNNVGMQLLEECEKLRDLMNEDEEQLLSDSEEELLLPRSAGRSTNETPGSTTDPSHRYGSGRRKHATETVDRIRRKVEVSALRELGPRSVVLWSLTLKMIVLGRVFAINQPDTTSQEHGKESSEQEDITTEHRENDKRFLSVPEPFGTSHHWANSELPPLDPEEFPPLTELSLRPRKQSNKSSVPYPQIITIIPPTAPTSPKPSPAPTGPVTPARRSSKSTEKHEKLEKLEKLSSRLRKSAVTPVRKKTARKTTDWLADLDAWEEAKLFRDLPNEVWRRIVAFIVDPLGVMTDEQQRAVLAFAWNRETLAWEKELASKPDSAQIWHVLEAVGCLE